ncbi:MAG: UDP-N-acetylglucosamine 4,6-dehydratase (inverting) [Pseudomonadota bacterium]
MNVTQRAFDRPRPNLDGKTILITGGTGSFGKALLQRLLSEYDCARIVVFSRDEQKHVALSREIEAPEHVEIEFYIGDVRDLDRLQEAMAGVDYVVHAAAMKHIHLAEEHPSECINTNILGAMNVVKAAYATGVSKVVALSTDKACSPVNLYGASKLAADKIFVAANQNKSRGKATFSVVRYGNVVGSVGSVIPFFRKLVAEGAEFIPITDERMTRFWITMDQGVNLVLSTLTMMRGAEIFVPKIPSMRIVDLAKAMAPDLPQRHVGIRPGEKLHEVMISSDDALYTYDAGDRYVILPNYSKQSLPPDIGQPVEDSFTYSSDRNEEWFDIPEFLALIGH